MNPVKYCSGSFNVTVFTNGRKDFLCKGIGIAVADMICTVVTAGRSSVGYLFSRHFDRDLSLCSTDIAGLINSFIDQIVSSCLCIINSRIVKLENRRFVIIIRYCYSGVEIQLIGIAVKHKIVYALDYRRRMVIDNCKGNLEYGRIAVNVRNGYRNLV